jgi:type IV pilus assembly protein PilC
MRSYRYKYITPEGKTMRGIIRADHQQNIHALVESGGNHLLKLRKLTPLESLFANGKRSNEEIGRLTLQWWMLLKAGVSIPDSVKVISETHPTAFVQSALKRIGTQLQSGESLFQSLKTYPELFNTAYCHAIHVGEQKGKIIEAFEHLVDHLKKKGDIHEKLKKATFYPLLLMSVIGLLVFSLGFLLLPQFKEFVGALGYELPLSTRLLFGVGEAIDQQGLYFLIVFLLLNGLGFMLYFFSSRFAEKIDQFLLKIPILGRLILLNHLICYLTDFRILCDNGHTVLKALKESPEAVENRFLQKQLQRLSLQIHEGFTLEKLFCSLAWFPRTITQMIKVGECSGQLTQALSISCDYLQTDLWQGVEAYLRILEPLLLLVIGLFLLWIVVAVFLPLYDHIGVMQ